MLLSWPDSNSRWQSGRRRIKGSLIASSGPVRAAPTADVTIRAEQAAPEQAAPEQARAPGPGASVAYRHPDPQAPKPQLEMAMPGNLSSVAVYCGSSRGADPCFAAAAASLGRLLAERGIRLVYGGGHVGLMGVLADAALSRGGEVHGVITRALDEREIAHRGLTALDIVETMHERKAAMADRSDGFIMLPGGFGTLDEFFEVVTWTQLGIHAKPCGILNVNGFFDPLLVLLETAIQQRFLHPEHRGLVVTDSDPASLIEVLGSWAPVAVDKWLDRSQR